MSVPGIGLSIASKVLIDDWMSFPDIIQALSSENLPIRVKNLNPLLKIPPSRFDDSFPGR